MVQTSPLISVLIVSKDRPNILIGCLKSVSAQTYENREIIILDDNSSECYSDKIGRALTDEPLRCLRSDITLGVAAGRNKLIKEAKGDFLVMLDDDAAFKGEKSLSKIIELFNSYPDVGLFAFRIVDIVDSKQAGTRVPHRKADIKRNPEILNLPHYVSYFVGAGHAARKEVFEKCGLYQNDLMYSGEELDLSYRIIENGYRIFYASQIIIEHYPGQTDLSVRIVKAGYLYFAMRNKIWINYKYLPWYAFAVNTFIWCAIRLAFSIVKGGFTQVISGIKDGFKGLKKLNRNPISKETLNYIRLNGGRIFY